jgi:hypothetical protein
MAHSGERSNRDTSRINCLLIITKELNKNVMQPYNFIHLYTSVYTYGKYTGKKEQDLYQLI